MCKSKYVSQSNNVCREKYLLEQNARMERLVRDIIEDMEQDSDTVVTAAGYEARLEEITNA